MPDPIIPPELRRAMVPNIIRVLEFAAEVNARQREREAAQPTTQSVPQPRRIA